MKKLKKLSIDKEKMDKIKKDPKKIKTIEYEIKEKMDKIKKRSKI